MDENQAPYPEEDEISLLDLITALGKEKRLLFGTPIVAVLLAVAYTLTVTPIYTARTLILPPQQQQNGASAALASMGAFAGIAGLAAGVKSQDEMYVALFKSRSLQDDLIQRYKLKERYPGESPEGLYAILKDSVRITSDKKSGLITLEVDDQDPAFSANLANGHVDALRGLLSRLAVTEAQQRRVFFEQQIKNTQTALNTAEQAFRSSRERGGMQVTDALAEVSATASAELRAQIAAKEVELAAMRQFATAANPDLQLQANALAALRSQLAKIEQGSGQTNPAIRSTGQDAVNAFRDVKIRQAILEVLIKQYEMARADEAREGPLLQQVDIATPPEQKSQPARTKIVMLAGLAGLFLGLVAALVRSAWRKAKGDPESASRMVALKQAWIAGWWKR
jgi:uncharacterized protein involved in exopolysaccharide biosynthesis